MQASYRSFQQPPQRSPHAAAPRRGIGPMIAGAHSQTPLSSQLQAQESHKLATESARLRSSKPTDKNIPDGIEECVIGDGVQRYRDLRDMERKLDAAMMRKRLDIQDSQNRNVKRYRTLRIWISNTVEDQPWQADALDVDAFDFSTNMDSSYRVKIEGRLLDEEEGQFNSDDDDDKDCTGEDEEPESRVVVDEDGKDKRVVKKRKGERRYRFSHFFKSMTVDFERNRMKDGVEQSVEWKKPAILPNDANPPSAADFDQLEFKRCGDENVNITINLVRDEPQERFSLSPALSEIMDTGDATRGEIGTGIWEYIRIMGLQHDEEKRSFRCDDLLKRVFQRDTGYIPFIPEVIIPHLSAIPPIKLPYTIRVDQEFHKDPQPTVYDIRVVLDDPLRARLHNFSADPSYPTKLREITSLNDKLATLIQAISHSKAKHTFLTSLSKDPSDFFKRLISSQQRDLEVLMGEAARGGGEDANGEEWRRGGPTGVWGTENVRESVNLLLSARPR